MSPNRFKDSSITLLSTTQEIYHQLHANAIVARQRQNWRQGGIVALAVVATGLATLPYVLQRFPDLGWLLPLSQAGLVLVEIGFVILVGIFNRGSDGQDWMTLLAGAAAIKRVEYLYRTLLQAVPERSVWLNRQLADIQQQLQDRLAGNWVIQPTLTAPLEPLDRQDLLADEYVQQRILPALDQSKQQISRLTTDRDRYQLIILTCAAAIVLLSLSGLGWMGGGAIASTLALGILVWMNASQLNQEIEIHSQLILGLTLLRDHWQSLLPEERTVHAFFHLVMAAEKLLESPYSQLSDQVREVMHNLRGVEPDLAEQVLTQPIPISLEQALRASSTVEIVSTRAVLEASAAIDDATEATTTVDIDASKEAETDAPAGEEVLRAPVTGAGTSDKAMTNGKTSSTPAQGGALVKHGPVTKALPPEEPPPRKRGRPHAFVVMPFGRKQGADGRWIDFNSIYQDLIKPAIEAAGLESFRADEEASSGDIITDMFQELLLADLVVADLSIDNANVFYELGIRHALRRRGVVHIQAGRSYMPFDIVTVRTLPYRCDESGRPDPEFVEKDKQALMKMIQATWTSERNRIHSPIFSLLTGLPEPDRKALRTPLARGYWEEYTKLQELISVAQRKKRIGDVVLLAEEVSNPLIKEDIITEAGKALKSMGNSALALKEYRQGLKINPENIGFRCEEAYHLSRLGQSDEAIVKFEKLLQDSPYHVDATAYLARIYKDLWKQTWMAITDDEQRIHAAYESSFLLQKSIENYLRGYRIDQNQYYPGINALTLTALLDHLAAWSEIDSGDVDENSYRKMLPAIIGSVRFCLESALSKAPNDPWVALSIGDLSVCTAESPHHVATAYRKALALLWNNKFGIQAALDQLKLMQGLNFRPEFVQAGISVLQTELDRIERQEQMFISTNQEEEVNKPSQVFLFAGHMVDRPDREKPRFPAAMEPEVAEKIDAVLTKLSASANCIAIVPGLACGGDIIFVEACLKRNLQIELYLPFDREEFIKESVSFAGDTWTDRFNTIFFHPNVTPHIQPKRLGPVPKGDDVFERNNKWALYSTLMYDIRRVRLIVLWDGQSGGDGPGGTADMVQQVRQLGGVVEHIDTNKFDYWKVHHNKTLDQIFHKLEF